MLKNRNEINALRAYVPGKPVEDVQKEFGLLTVVKLASNENPYGCSNYAKNAVLEALELPSQYPDGNCTNLRNALSKKLSITPEQLIFGAGSDEIITMIANVYIGNNDEAITCTPSFPRYNSATTMMGGTMLEVPLKNHTYDLDGIVNRITKNTKVIFISNPNNPTGTIIKSNEQLDFIKRVPKDILIVLDEAYYEYVYDTDYPNSRLLLKEHENIIILRTFSKMYGLASMRVGYGFANTSIISLLNRVRGPFNINTMAQVAALSSLSDEDFINKCFTANKEVKAYTYHKCNALGLDYIETHGNFIMIDCKKPSLEVFQELQKIGFIVRPGFYFGMDTYQRVTLGTKEEMEQFFEAIMKIID